MSKRILAVMMALVMVFSCMPAMYAGAEEVPAASGTTYYVSSVSGAEGNDGTSESAPFASLLKINEIELQPGDRVLLERGSVFVDEYLHVKGSGAEGSPIIIDAYGDENLPLPLIQTNGNGVWHQDYGKRADNVNHQIKGDVSSCILLFDVEYIEISNIAMTNEGNFAAGEVYNTARRMDRTGVAGVAQNKGTLDHIYLRNLDIRNVQGNVYNKHMCNGGIYFVCHYAGAGKPVARYNDVLIEGCRLDEVNRWGIAVGYTAYWDGIPYAMVIPEESILTNGSSNVVIRGNYLTNIGGDGITTMYCYKPLIEYNVLDGYAQDITDSVYQYPENRGGKVAAGIWPWMCKTPIFQYNECYTSTYNQDGQAWDADYGDNCVYQYNYSCNNAGGTIMFCGTYACNTVFRYNISQDDLSGVLNITGSPNGEVYNNVFFMKEGVYVNRLNMSGGWGNTVSNNIFYYNSDTPASAALSNWGDIGAEWSNNIYYNFSKIPNDPHAITADPLFVDPGKAPTGAQASGLVHDISAFEGYKLQENSPAINAGTPIANRDIYYNSGKDFFGNKLDLIPDIGAYEAGTFVSDATKAVTVDLELGQSVTITDVTGNYADTTPIVEDGKITSVALSGTSSAIRTHGDAVTELTDGKYILVNNRAGKTLTNQEAAPLQGGDGSISGLSLDGTISSIPANAIWNVTASGEGFTVRDAAGKYLAIDNKYAGMVDDESVVNVIYENGNWTLSRNGAYLNDASGKGTCAAGWNGWDGWSQYDAAADGGSQFTIYPVTEEVTSSTELTFTGLFPGSTSVTVGDTLYIVRVAGEVEEVELTVGETVTIEDLSGNYTDADTGALDASVATVELDGVMVDVYSLGSKVTTLTDGGKYILVNTRANKPVTNLPYSGAAGLLFTGTKEAAAPASVWTITAADNGYYVQDLAGNYMTVGADSAALTGEAHALSLNYTGSTWTISENGAYLNHFGGSGSTRAAGWKNAAAATDAGSQWEIYQVSVSQAENGTAITFTGVGEGSTYVLIGGTGYEITVTGDAEIYENPFTDVIEGKFYFEAVEWAVKNNITKGMTDTTFEPDTKCNRGQVVTFLWRAAGSPEPNTTEHSFTDVEEGKFYYKAMLWAVEKGITKGMTETTFDPNGICTRGQVVTFLWRAKNKPAATNAEHSFTDVKEGKFYYDAMLWAVENKITEGMSSTTFAPNNTCNRGQVVTFLYRAYK